MSRIGCIALTIVAAFAGVGVLATHADASPSDYWGVVPQGALSEEQFRYLSKGGVESVRIPVDWESIQPIASGPYDWGGIDSQIEDAALAGLEVLPFVSGAPTWAVPSVYVPGTGRSLKAPAHLPAAGLSARSWSAFLATAVGRYGPGGTFWTEHLNIPEMPVRAWQIWNEPNFKYFIRHPSPTEYGELVKVSSRAIKGVDPGARVLLAGLFAQPKGARDARTGAHKSLNWYASDFLEKMYQTNPGIRASFDGVSLHPYSIDYTELAPEIEETRRVLAQSHDASESLYITELGWSSEAPNPSVDQFAKGPAGQVAELKGAYGVLDKMRAKWRLRSVYWFSVNDASGCNFCGGSGLFTNLFVPKRSWFAYAALAGSGN